MKSFIIGRQAETEQLQTFFEATASGNGNIVLLSGEAGMGKTMLAEECLAESQLHVFTGRAQQETTPAYGPITAVLRNFLRRQSSQTIDCGSLTPYLALILPELGAPPEDPDRDTLVAAIASALDALTCDGPAAIFLDDLQWADDATLEILPALADHLAHKQLLILGTYRSDEIPRGHRLRWVRNELRRRRQLNEISVEPLDKEASQHLMHRVFGEAPSTHLTNIIFEKTTGVPLFVEELAGALIDQNQLRKSKEGLTLPSYDEVPIPESIRDAVLLRMDNLSDAARNQLTIAAVAGTQFDMALITELSGSEEGLDELFSRQLIFESEPGKGAFRHALTRDAVRSDILWTRRRTLNGKIAEYLEKKGAAPESIADHWLAANELPKARKALIAAAKFACHLHAYGDAVRSGHKALEIWPAGEEEMDRLATLQQLARCAQINGQLNDAVRALREVAESNFLSEDHPRRGEVQQQLAAIYGLLGSWELSLNARKTAAQAFEIAEMPGEAAMEWLSAASRSTGLNRLADAIEWCDRAESLALQAERFDIQSRALALKGNVLSMQGKSEVGIETVNNALSIALAHNLSEAASEVYRRLGSTLEYASDYNSSRDAYFTAYNYCRQEGVDIQAHLCLGCMSWVLFRTGEWKQCLEICKEVINDEKATESSKSVSICVMGLIRTYKGSMRQARNLLQSALNQARRDGAMAIELIAYWGMAQIEEVEGDTEAAETYYRQILALQQRMHDTHDSLTALFTATGFFARQGQETEVAECINVLSNIASLTGNNEVLGILAYALGEMALLNDNSAEALQRFEQALSNFKLVEIPVERLKLEYRIGQVHAGQGNTERAIEYLNNAYRMARNLGARPLAGQIAESLHALGVPAEERRDPDASERANRAGLTRRQIEVARLISDGYTNKEIGNKLFLSTRTVEMHVANMLDRLDCRSRSEAVRKAIELGLL